MNPPVLICAILESIAKLDQIRRQIATDSAELKPDFLAGFDLAGEFESGEDISDPFLLHT